MNAQRDLVELSSYAARHPRFVQGGGGNCSVKTGGRMLVKASGYFLEDVTEKDGYSILERATGLPHDDGRPRPSLEAPLHLLLGTYVIHTHPIAVAALVCAREGRDEFRRLFPEAFCHWIPYATPGQELYESLQERMSSLERSPDGSIVLFLENHGLFVSAESVAACTGLHDRMTERAEAFFGQPADEGENAVPGYLTPDHAVYAKLDPEKSSGRQKQTARELRALIRGVLSLIRSRGWHPVCLSDANVARILGMDEEKYRQQILKEKP